MAEINFNQIYDGITLALHHAYPTSCIHGGTVKQDLQDGDIAVLPITTNHTEQMGARAKQKPVFDVIYYPSRAGGRAESLQIAQQLAYILRTVKTPNGDNVHCLSFDTTIEDDALHCTVGYPYFVRTQTVSESMDNLKIEIGE